jgi:DNA-binding GntR family transcriptional regulator
MPATKRSAKAPRRAADSVNRVYAAIREMAVSYEFRPEQRINEVELAAALKVSRTPVREALNRLVIEGLITLVPNKGFFCRAFDADEIMHLFEVRAALEMLAVRLACQRGEAADFADLAEFWSGVTGRQAEMSAEELTGRDEEFHTRIARLSGNPEILRMIEGVNARIRFVRRIEIESPRRRETTFCEHLGIVEAMTARDAERAAALMAEHITISVADAVEAMKEGLARIYMRRQPA